MQPSTLISDARASAGLTLRSLAAAAGTSHSTLSAYEHGTKEPSIATLQRILAASGVRLTLSVATRCSPSQDRGAELEQVLELAGHFPAEHAPRLTCPVFGR